MPPRAQPGPTAARADEEATGGRPRRRRLGRALAELHYRLRTEGGTPIQDALSVGMGVVIGCLPLYGLHLPLCVGLATLLRVGRLKCYLAAHVNNPLTAPLLLYLELGVGRWLVTGTWPSVAPAAIREAGLFVVSRDLAIGSLVVGVVLGMLVAAATWWVSARARLNTAFEQLLERAAMPYLEGGIRHWEFVRAKLRYDPLYRAMLESDLLPEAGRLIDLGCGRGILLSLVSHAAEGGEGARGLELVGVEVRAKTAVLARAALGERATIVEADLMTYRPPPAAVAVLLDVLHYLPADAQETALARAASALEPGGRLIVREADAAMGWRFTVTRAAERLRAIGRGHFRQRFHYRSASAWRSLLESSGLETDDQAMWAGTPFGNRVLVGTSASTATRE